MKRTSPKAGRLPLGDPRALAALQALANATTQKIAADSLGVSEGCVRNQLNAARVTDELRERLVDVGALRESTRGPDRA